MFEAITDSGMIRAYGEVGWPEEGFTSQDFFAALDGMDGRDVSILMGSRGGDVQQGISIYNQLRDYPGQVSIRIDGESASIASVLMLGADWIEAYPQTMFMVHNPWTIVMGDAAAFRSTARVLDILGDDMAEIYAERTNRGKDYWTETMADETYFSAEDAVEVGLVHSLAKHGKKSKPAAAKRQSRPRIAALHALRAKMDTIAKSLDARRREP